MAVDDRQDPQGFVKEKGYNWTFASTTDDLQALYSIQAVPTTLFVNKDGVVIDKIEGGMEQEQFEAELAKIF